MPLTLHTGGNKLRRAPQAGGPTGPRVRATRRTAHGPVLPCRAPGPPGACGPRRAAFSRGADPGPSRESERSLPERPVKSRWEGPENKR